jgi:molybdopterin-guanine dinucleotide biosynthesis protein A
MPEIAAVVLAGGAGRRMGGVEKPLLDLAGRPILARIVAALIRDTDLIAINANGDPARFAEFVLPVLADEFAGEGPLAGVLAGMEWAAEHGAAALLTVPGDTPFIPAGLPQALAPPPACAYSSGHAHHLVALWPVGCRQELREMLSRPGRRDVAGFASRIGTRAVDFPAGAWDPFLNVNTPADLAAARRFAECAGTEDPP